MVADVLQVSAAAEHAALAPDQYGAHITVACEL
jgi:hypothetical protein